MRLSPTVVDGRTGRAVDSLVDLDPAQPVGDLVQPLTELLGDQVHSGFARRVPLWVDGVAVSPTCPPGSSGSGTAAWSSSSPPTWWLARCRTGWPSSGWCRVRAPAASTAAPR